MYDDMLTYDLPAMFAFVSCDPGGFMFDVLFFSCWSDCAMSDEIHKRLPHSCCFVIRT